MNKIRMNIKYILSVAGISLAVGMLYFGMPVQASVKAGDITGGKKAPHVNIAAFHKLHGQEGFKYPEHITSSDILHALQGKAQFIFINHTAGLKDGDVITVANDVLREESGHFSDFGVDCQMSVHIRSNVITLSGLCEILMLDQDHREIEHKLLIKPVDMQVGKGWILLYYDAEDGIAIYADGEIGLE